MATPARPRTRHGALALLLLFASAAHAADAPSRFVESEGVKVHYKSYGEGSEALVFVHGWTCDLTFWEAQRPLFETRRSLLIDLPGHGESAKPDVEYTLDRFARAIDAVMRDSGVERATLIGHSMGGPVVRVFGRMYPAKTSGIVFVDVLMPAYVTGKALEDRRKSMVSRAAAYDAPEWKSGIIAAINSMFVPSTPAKLRAEILAKMTATPRHVAKSASLRMWDNEFYKEDPMPVRFAAINAERGSKGNEAHMRKLFPNLALYEEWKGAGHFLMMEQPDRFNKALAGFLAKP